MLDFPLQHERSSILLKECAVYLSNVIKVIPKQTQTYQDIQISQYAMQVNEYKALGSAHLSVPSFGSVSPQLPSSCILTTRMVRSLIWLASLPVTSALHWHISLDSLSLWRCVQLADRSCYATSNGPPRKILWRHCHYPTRYNQPRSKCLISFFQVLLPLPFLSSLQQSASSFIYTQHS